MPGKDDIKNPQILIISGLIFLCWYSFCLIAHVVGIADSAINATALCLLADIGAISGLILLAVKRKQAQTALLIALIAETAFLFYMYNLDPGFPLYQVAEILKPTVCVFIILTLVWYTHVATENKWVT